MNMEKSVKDWKKSEKHGAAEWVSERLTSLILLPLVGWAIYAAIGLSGKGMDAAMAFVKVPMHAGLLIVMTFISVWHAFMGLKVIIDDYIHKSSTRGFLIFLNFVFNAGLFVITTYALYILHNKA